MTEPERLNLVAFKARMGRVARKNNDEFKVTTTVDEKGFHLEVTETADGHTLLSAHGSSVGAALEAAVAELPASLKSWGYSE